MPLNINYATGGAGIQQADKVVDSSRAFGSNVSDVAAVPRAVPGQFGNYKGEIAQAESLSRVANALDDVATRENNLKVANETARRKLQEQDQKAADFKARQQVEDTAKIQDLTADDKEQLYQQLLDGNLSDVNSKYTYDTTIGNNIDEWNTKFSEAAKFDYKTNVVEKYRVQEFQVAQQQAFDKTVGNLITGFQQDGNPVKAIQGIQQLSMDLGSPAFTVAMGGPVAAERAKVGLISKATQDVLNAMPFKLQRDLLDTTNEVIDPATGKPTSVTKDPKLDPLAWMDASQRQTLFKQADQLYRVEQSDIAKRRSEAQEAEGQKYISMLELAGSNPGAIKQVQHSMMGFLNTYLNGTEEEKAQLPLSFKQVNSILARSNDNIDKVIKNNLSAATLAERKAERLQLAKQREQDQYDKVVAAAESGSQSATDKLWQLHIVPELAGKKATPQQVEQAAWDLAERTGKVPGSIVIENQRALYNTQDPKALQQGHAFFKTMQEKAPAAYAKLPDRTKILAAAAEQMPPSMLEEYMKRYDNRIATKGELTAEDRKAAAKALPDPKKAVANAAGAAGWFGFGGVSKVPQEAADEYSSTFAKILATTGDADVAKKIADQNIATKYGKTKAGDTEVIVKMPVEMTYGDKFSLDPEQASEAIHTQLADELKAKNVSVVNPRLIYAGTDPKDGQAVYTIHGEDENGSPIVVKDATDGTVLSYKPDVAAYRVKRDAELRKEATKAQKKADWEKFKRTDGLTATTPGTDLRDVYGTR